MEEYFGGNMDKLDHTGVAMLIALLILIVSVIIAFGSLFKNDE